MYNNMCGMCNLSIMESWCRSSSSLAAEMLTLYLRRHEATSPPRCPDTPAADWQSQGRPSAYAHTHTHIQTQALQVSISTLSQHLLQQLVAVIDHRCVRPVGVVEGEVLDAVFWLLGVGDTCREETAVTGFR